ncbi:MAG: TPM domain-containing protein [Steroidobacteraceae bacterium]
MRVARLGTGLLLLLGCALAGAEVAVPPLSARVIDLTGTLSGGAVARIEAKLADFEAKKGSQFVVLMVPSTQPEEIEQYGIRVAEAWKLGRKGVDDGAILLVAKNDRRARIEVGYGLEGALPDAIANRIIAETVTPHFKLGDFDGGVEAGVNQMISVVNGEPLPPPDTKWEHTPGITHLLPILLVIVVVAGGVLRSMFGRVFGSIATGGLAGVIAWLVSHLLPIGLGAGVVAFLFAMLTGGSRGGWTGGGGWGGGLGGLGGLGGGGRGGGGFGGGGFSGGGGGFGGGGASGSW